LAVLSFPTRRSSDLGITSSLVDSNNGGRAADGTPKGLGALLVVDASTCNRGAGLGHAGANVPGSEAIPGFAHGRIIHPSVSATRTPSERVNCTTVASACLS